MVVVVGVVLVLIIGAIGYTIGVKDGYAMAKDNIDLRL
jgi:hypothetical protein